MADDHAVDDASALGAARLVAWTKDDKLIPRGALAHAWQMSAEDIEAAVQRGDLFEVRVDDLPYVSSELIALGAHWSFEVCRALGDQGASSKLIFLLHPHGGLGGKTVAEARRTGTPLARILLLAQAAAHT